MELKALMPTIKNHLL